MFDHNSRKFGMNRSDRQFFINMLNTSNDKELRELLNRSIPDWSPRLPVTTSPELAEKE
jgi:hypothetical protein